MKRSVFILIAALLLCADPFFAPKAMMQSEEFTLAGEWRVDSSAIDGENFSRLGNTLGFPQRDMFFSQSEEGTRTGFVKREDVGTNVNPLGVWRISGDRFSATFQLWCPNAGVCGTVIMRGRFLEADRIRGTMTVFFDAKDSRQSTGYDTWVFSFRGNRVEGGTGR